MLWGQAGWGQFSVTMHLSSIYACMWCRVHSLINIYTFMQLFEGLVRCVLLNVIQEFTYIRVYSSVGSY